jgi:hypothetical protein
MTDHEDDDKDQEGGDKPRFTEIMRELALSGLATYFMTEDAIRSYLKEMKLPKELVSLVLEGVTKKKDDFYGLLVKEFGRVLSKVDISREVGKFMEHHRVVVEAKVSFEPRSAHPKPEVKSEKGG